jgi:hypothetical protein
MIFLRAETKNILSLHRFGLRIEEQIKPVAYRAFVVTEKIQKRLKAKQRQQEQILLLMRACLSFVVSFF